MRAQAGVRQTSTTGQLKRKDHACRLKTRTKKQNAVLACTTLHNHGETVATWASTLGTRAADFLFRPVRSPLGCLDFFGRGCVFAGPDDPDRRVGCDGATRVENVSYHLADVASGVLLEPKLTVQISSIGARLFPAYSPREDFKPPLFRLGFI